MVAVALHYVVVATPECVHLHAVACVRRLHFKRAGSACDQLLHNAVCPVHKPLWPCSHVDSAVTCSTHVVVGLPVHCQLTIYAASCNLLQEEHGARLDSSSAEHMEATGDAEGQKVPLPTGALDSQAERDGPGLLRREEVEAALADPQVRRPVRLDAMLALPLSSHLLALAVPAAQMMLEACCSF